MRLRLFGSFELEGTTRVFGVRDFGGVKPKQIFEILALERGHPVSKDRLAELLWGGGQPRNASATLETYVSLLRRQVEEAAPRTGRRVIATAPGAYVLNVVDLEIDLDLFDRLKSNAAKHLAGGDREGRASARADLSRALGLVRGEVLEDEPFAGFAAGARATYQKRHVEALLLAADAARLDADYAALVEHAEAAIERDRACEQAFRHLMLAQHGLGRSEAALDTFLRCRTALAEELGIEPAPETLALRDAIRRRGDPLKLHPGAVQQRGTVARAAPAPRELPFIGRADELASLGAVARSAIEGQAALVLLEGEPGVGKSRMLARVMDSLPAYVRRASARCLSLEKDLPFAPLAEALRPLFGELPPSPLRYPSLGELMPELGAPDRPAEGERFRALSSLATWIIEHAPLALILDDLHWSDPSTLAAIGFLVRRCAAAPVLLLGAYRHNDVPGDHPLHQLEPALRLRLEPLPPEEVDRLGIERLHEKTGGNPLLMVEYARALASGRTDGMSPTLREVVLTRMRAAGPAAHRLLAVAAVLGRSFAADALAFIVDETPSSVLEHLEELVRDGLLVAGGDRFDFRHDLIREVLYQSLSEPRRRHLHRRALEVLEKQATTSAELAHHAEAGFEPAAALRFSLRAGDEARLRWANFEAIAHYQRAHRVMRAHPELVEAPVAEALVVRMGRLLSMTGRAAEAEAVLFRVQGAAEARGDDRGLFEILEARAMVRHRGASVPSEALPLAERALGVAERLGDPALVLRAHGLMGGPLSSLGRLDESLAHLKKAMDKKAMDVGDPAPVPAALYGRVALNHHLQGREAEALVWADRAEAGARAEPDEETVVMARWIRGLSLAALGRGREAWRSLDSIAEIGKGEEIFWHARVPNTYGSILADVCLYDRALDRNLQSLEATRRSSLRPVREAELQTLLNLAGDHLGLGRLDDARARLEEVRRKSQDVEYARFRLLVRLHALDAELALAQEQPERARMAAESCLLLAEKHGQLKYDVRGRIVLARALAALGRRAAALKAARSALTSAEKLDLPALTWRAAWAAFQIGGGARDKVRAQKAVLRLAAGLDEPLRAAFLSAVPVDR